MKGKRKPSRGKWLRWLRTAWVLLTIAAALRPFVRLAWELGSYLQQVKPKQQSAASH